MNCFLLLIALIDVTFDLATGYGLHPNLQNPVSSDYDTFKLWMTEFDIRYPSVEEEARRYHVWTDRVQNIKKHNSIASVTWTMGVNQFTAHTEAEMKSILMTSQNCSATDHHSGEKPIDFEKLLLNGKITQPDSIDWRDEKVISEVKDQGDCGSCWTFSTTGCLEAHNAINTGQLILFSEQNLVDCANAFNNFGCDGGLPSQAFEYIRYNGGINTEFYYPYNGTTGKECKFKTKTGAYGGIIDSVYNITQYDETEIYTSVGTTGPVSIAFDVVSDFFDYQSGIYQSSQCGNTTDSVNHAVLIVGYGSDMNLSQGMPYWIVKNSWNWNWGNQGYFYIERGKNMCGLASCASFPVLMN